jgi:hypothetical protein
VESTWLLQIHAEVTKGGKAGVKGVRPFLFIPQVSLFPAVLSYLRSTQVCPRLKPHAISADSGSGLVAAATYLVRRGGLRYQLIAKATYLVRHGRLRFILRSRSQPPKTF